MQSNIGAPLALVPLPCGYAARLEGLDLARGVGASTLDAIRAAFARYPVLAFPGQQLDPAGLEGFAGSLGAFGEDPYVEAMPGHPHVIEVCREATETAPIFGSQWHSDWSFQATPPSATLLYGSVIPPRGGDTVFADACGAWEALSPTLRDLLARLDGVHSAAPSYGPKGLFSRDDASRSMRIIVSADAERCQPHPIARRHLESGRTALYVNHVYTIGIDGMHLDESRALLDFLCRHLTREEFVHRHRWEAGTLLMWDNRRVVHYADGGYEGHRRLMYRSTLAGERPLRA